MPNDLDTYSGDSNKQLTIKDIGDVWSTQFSLRPLFSLTKLVLKSITLFTYINAIMIRAIVTLGATI
jgi:hypothetical protein